MSIISVTATSIILCLTIVLPAVVAANEATNGTLHATVAPVPRHATVDEADSGYDATRLTLITPQANPASDFEYTQANGTVTIMRLKDEHAKGDVIIPTQIHGLPVTAIVEGAFAYCKNVTSITIPSGVTHIEPTVFLGGDRLTEIVVSTENSTYQSRDGVLFAQNGQTLHCCPGGKRGVYPIPNGVTRIGEAAFIGCNRLTGIEIPNSVTTISERPLFAIVYT